MSKEMKDWGRRRGKRAEDAKGGNKDAAAAEKAEDERL